MKIWIISQETSLPTIGINSRHHFFAKELAARGHEVAFIAARETHLTRDLEAARAMPPVAEYEGYRFVSIDLPSYVGAHSRQRALNWLRFGWKLRGVEKMLGQRPDAILYSSPPLPGYIGAAWLARRFRARLAFEVRDFWPLTLTMIGGFSPRHPAVQLMNWIERRAYRGADHVISNLTGAFDHMQGLGLSEDRYSWLPNGQLLSEIRTNAPLRQDLVDGWPKAPFIVGYTGSMGAANRNDTIVEAATLLRDRPDIAFVLMGNGGQRPELEALCAARGLTNVHFFDPVPLDHLNTVLQKCDVLVSSAPDSPIYQFGIASLKICEYLFSGRPILFAYSGKYDPITTYGAGLTVPAAAPEAFAEAVVALYDMGLEARAQMGRNGQAAARKYHDYAKTALRLEHVLMGRPEKLETPAWVGMDRNEQ